MNRAEQHRLIEALPDGTIVSAHRSDGRWKGEIDVLEGSDRRIRLRGEAETFVRLIAELAWQSEANQAGEPT